MDHDWAGFRGMICERIRHDPSSSVRMSVTRGQALFNVGDRDSAVYLVERGLLNGTTYSSNGKRCLLHVYSRGDVIGEYGLLGYERQETMLAMEDSIVHQIGANQFLALLEDRRLAEHFSGYLMSRLVEQQQTITSLVTMDSEHRLAATLLRLAARLGRMHPGGLKINAKITHEDLASMVGTTRSRVGLFLKRFRSAGLVDALPGSYLLIDEVGLTDFVGSRAGSRPVDIPHRYRYADGSL